MRGFLFAFCCSLFIAQTISFHCTDHGCPYGFECSRVLGDVSCIQVAPLKPCILGYKMCKGECQCSTYGCYCVGHKQRCRYSYHCPHPQTCQWMFCRHRQLVLH